MEGYDKPAAYFQNDPINFKTGFMVKQGGRIKTWKRRMFVLDRKNKVLRYYSKPEDTFPKGVVHIVGYQVLDADETVKKPFSFMIQKEGFRTFYMVCDDFASKNSWMEDIRETAKLNLKGGAHNSFAPPAFQGQTSDDSEPSEDEDPTLRRAQPTANPDITLAKRPNEEQTLVKSPNKTQDDTMVNIYDPGATLGGYNFSSDPNATLISDVQDPHLTLIGDSHPRAAPDSDATLMGGGDDNATLVADNAANFVNNSARLRAQGAAPQAVPHLRMVPFLAYFPIVERDVIRTLKFGRKKDDGSNDPDFVGFDSKVVSRRHAEIWVVHGDFYIRDTRSQSGTFLNAMRLSLPGEESKPFKLRNGDTVQLGVDLRGSVDPSTKCVSVTIELSFTRPSEPSPRATIGLNMSDLTLVSGHH